MSEINSINKLDPQNIVIFRALQLGNMLNLVPALRALRAANPAARVCLFGLPWVVQSVQRFHTYLDDFIGFAGWPGLPQQAPNIGRNTPGLILFSVPDQDRCAPRDRQLHKTLQHSMSWTADEVLLHAERHLKEVHSHV